MAFTPDTDCFPKAISIKNSVVLVKSGAVNKISVLVANETSYNIQLDKDAYHENVEIIKSIALLQIKNVSATYSCESVKSETINNTKSADAVTPMEEAPS